MSELQRPEALNNWYLNFKYEFEWQEVSEIFKYIESLEAQLAEKDQALTGYRANLANALNSIERLEAQQQAKGRRCDERHN